MEQETIDAIQTIRRLRTETQSIEAKSAKSGFPKCLDTLSSFSNKNGGLIIFGLSENKDFIAEGVYDIKQLQQKLTGVSKGSMTPSLHIDILPFEFEGKNLVAAKVHELPQNQKPCYITQDGISRGSYTRVGDSDERMTEYEIYALQSYTDNIQEDLRPIKLSSIDDLNVEELLRYEQKIKSEKPNFAKSPKDKFLKLSGIADGDIPTLAGTMVFGKYPQAYCPQLFIACSVIPGKQLGDLGPNGQRFNDNQRIEGTIEQMLAGTLGFLRRNMKARVVIDDDGNRKDLLEYPMKALREAIANALVHRDYSIHTERAYIQVYKYDDRIEIVNPGMLYGQNRIEKLGTSEMMETRNPNLVRLLEEKPASSAGDDRVLENRHSGIPTIRREMKKYHLPEPEFIEERGSFRVVLRSYETEPIDIVVDTVTDTVTDTVQDANQKILDFCQTPRSAVEIMGYLNMKSKVHTLKRYINPLLDDGRLVRTKPDKPHARDQKYTVAPSEAVTNGL